MINVIASISIKPGMLADYLEISKSNVPLVTQEQGCIEYVPTVDFDATMSRQDLDANLVIVIEKWASLDALQAHLRAPHMLTFREKVKDMIAQVSIKVLQAA
jgi:quinol monooxygenase YgiN